MSSSSIPGTALYMGFILIVPILITVTVFGFMRLSKIIVVSGNIGLIGSLFLLSLLVAAVVFFLQMFACGCLTADDDTNDTTSSSSSTTRPLPGILISGIASIIFYFVFILAIQYLQVDIMNKQALFYLITPFIAFLYFTLFIYIQMYMCKC